MPLSKGHGLVAEIATALPIAQSKLLHCVRVVYAIRYFIFISYISRIKYNSKPHQLGFFDDEEQAAGAYDLAARAYQKSPKLNFPRDGEKGGKGHGSRDIAATAKRHGLNFHRGQELSSR
jgi:hypothetical protein